MSQLKPQSFFVSFDDDTEAKSQSVSESLENSNSNNKDAFTRQLRQVAINLRLNLMSLPNVVGVSTKRVKMFNHLVISVRVRNNLTSWNKIELPNFLTPYEHESESSIQDNSVLATYSVMHEIEKGVFKSMHIENKPVILCILRERYNIESLKPPKNFIKSTKIHSVSS